MLNRRLRCCKMISVIIASMSFIDAYHCHILRLNCGKFADFSIQEEGRINDEYRIAVFQDVDRSNCYENCLHHHKCKSVNIAPDHGLCELVSVSPEDIKDESVTIAPDEGWWYHTTNYSNRLVGRDCRGMKNICNEDEICIQTCDCPGFICVKCTNQTHLKQIGVHCNTYCFTKNPCENGGRCIDGQPPRCECLLGYSGPTCSDGKPLRLM